MTFDGITGVAAAPAFPPGRTAEIEQLGKTCNVLIMIISTRSFHAIAEAKGG
jgi:hypothetical protein